MTQPPYQVYDFASSARVERPLWLAVNQWMQKYAELFCEHWANYSPTSISATPLSIDAHEFETFQAKWEQPTFSAHLKFANQPLEGLVVVNRQQILACLMDILGNQDDVVDRELTAIESSLCEMLFEQVATTICESWKGTEPLNVIVGGLCTNANREKTFAIDRTLLGCEVALRLGETETPILLEILFTKDELSDLLKIAKKSDKTFDPNAKLCPQKIAEVKVRVRASLGLADIPVDELMTISVGDVIVLDQAVNRPVRMYADGHPIFSAWPGKSGALQAMQIVARLN